MKKKVTAKEKTETWKKEEKIKRKEEKTKKAIRRYNPMLAKEKNESFTERIGHRRMEKRACWPEIGSSGEK